MIEQTPEQIANHYKAALDSVTLINDLVAKETKTQEDTNMNIPGLVYEENPEKLEAAYSKILPAMVKAIQELSAEVDALKRELSK
jgi:hypothetical protein